MILKKLRKVVKDMKLNLKLLSSPIMEQKDYVPMKIEKNLIGINIGTLWVLRIKQVKIINLDQLIKEKLLFGHFRLFGQYLE